MYAVRLILGILIVVVGLTLAGRRLAYLYRVGTLGQRVEPWRMPAAGEAIKAELVEVAAQRKLLRWTAPGLAHAAVFWGFCVLLLTIVEAFGAIFNPTFQIPIIGNWPALGFIQDLFALLCVAAVVAFAVIRFREAPKDQGRGSRFFGSHLGPAWMYRDELLRYHNADQIPRASLGVVHLPGLVLENRGLPNDRSMTSTWVGFAVLAGVCFLTRSSL